MTALIKMLANGRKQMAYRLIRSYQTLTQYEPLLTTFNATYPDMKKHLLNKFVLEDVKKKFGETLDYQLLIGSRQLRPVIALKVHEVMAPASDLDSEGLQRIHILGWICELLQSTAILLDDHLDEAPLRRGVPPWYVGREKFVGTHAGMLILASHILLRDFFGKDVFYRSADRVVGERNLDVCVQQLVDDLKFDAVRRRNIPWDLYKYFGVVRSLYCFETPFKLAAYEATKKDLQFDPLVDDILQDFGLYLSMMNDCLNIFPRLRKINEGAKDDQEDIKKEKMDLPMYIIFKDATKEDIEMVVANLGKNDQRCVEIVRDIYKKYNIEEECEKYVENLSNSIRTKIHKVSNENKLQDALIATQEILELHCSLSPSRRKMEVPITYT